MNVELHALDGGKEDPLTAMSIVTYLRVTSVVFDWRQWTKLRGTPLMLARPDRLQGLHIATMQGLHMASMQVRDRGWIGVG